MWGVFASLQCLTYSRTLLTAKLWHWAMGVLTVKKWGVLTVKTWDVLTVNVWCVLTVNMWGVFARLQKLLLTDSLDSQTLALGVWAS
eukprot:642286-Amorphochlora_amoeboformis.AAC.1